MDIIITYNDTDENNPAYNYNSVIEAIKICNSSIAVEQVIFRGFPMFEVKNLLFLIQEQVKTGMICFEEDMIYKKSEDPLFVKINDDVFKS